MRENTPLIKPFSCYLSHIQHTKISINFAKDFHPNFSQFCHVYVKHSIKSVECAFKALTKTKLKDLSHQKVLA